jgi:hypothetical protein
MIVNPKDMTDADLAELSRIVGRLLYAGPEVHDRLEKAGVRICRPDFYAESPTVAEMRAAREYKNVDGEYFSSDLYDLPAMLRILEELGEYGAAFNPPVSANDAKPGEYYWEAPAFSYSDALAYYCFIRQRRPKKIVEIGAGYSSLIALQALRENGVGTLHCVEPYPGKMLEPVLDRIALTRERAQNLAPDFLDRLIEPGDIVFIDSTHTVKVGGDVLHIYLKMLPAIRVSCLVHAHDIYLPFPFPLGNMEKHRVFWTEQYLLQAYMTDNPRVQPIYGSNLFRRRFPNELAAFMNGKWQPGGGSFWFEQVGRIR